MIVAASAEFNPTSSIAIEEDPLVNFGLIEAIGTAEARALLEFERSPGTPLQPVRPFLNIPVFPPPNPTTFIGGMINAQHATLHFGSGIVNQGIMAFTAGVNVVKGLVVQAGANAQLRIGPNTTVVIEGDCLGCVPTFVGGGNTLNILDPGTFTAAGIIQMTLSLSNPNLISAAGDIAISGLLDLTLANDVLADLATFGPGRYYEIISFTGGAYQPMIDENGFLVPDYSAPIPDCGTIIGPCSVPGMFAITSPDVSILGPAFADVEPIVQRIGHSIVVSFLDSGGIGVGLPGDYNNNGVVDAADYVVWRKHEGTTTVLPNDPFGGVIGANQYSLWRANFGAVPGAGAGGNSLSGTVPEPATLSVLLCIGLPALLRHRSR
jgi:hypothetical protein